MTLKPKDLINQEAFDMLAAEAPDDQWREIRVYVRKQNGKAEIRFAAEAKIVTLEGNELQ